MSNTKTGFRIITAVLAALLGTYLIATIFRSDVWGNILSPLNALAAAGTLLLAYLKSDWSKPLSILFLLYALACTIWGIADIIWAVISFSGGLPEDNSFLWVLYVLPNCIFTISFVLFAIQQFRKWDLVQFCVDLLVSGILSIHLFWILFLHRDMTALYTLLSMDFTSILSISTDIIIAICIISWFLSLRGGRVPGFLRIIAGSLLLFAFVDLLYYYQDYNGLYNTNSISDFLYIFALAAIAFGGLWKTYKNTFIFDISVVTNIGGRRRWLFLLLFPATTAFAVFTGLIPVHLTIGDFINIGILILLYWAICKYISVSLEKEALLRRSNEILELRVAEQVSELTFLANQDTLTTLINRRYFMTSLEDSIKNRLTSEIVALLVIDLDRFKTINDTFGHDVGDKVLIDLSYRLVELNNYGAIVARLGGDEFAIMFLGKYTQTDIEGFCTEIIKSCSRPIDIGENELNLTMSVGIAIASADGCDAKTLMQNADIAMYRAKAQGYNKYQVYDPFMSQDLKKAVEIEVLLRQADAEKDFELFFQPQYALPGRELIGAEALLRWRNAEHGYIPPNVFIPIAEQIDYIFRIGKWVMQETIRQAVIWNTGDRQPLKVGFNISPKQISDDNFVSLIKSLMTDGAVCPSWLDAEITESIMISDEDKVKTTFGYLRELGVTVSIDDFGSGYSSLGYLNKYPFDRIKIDKSLIDNINIRNTNGKNVVRAAINMAHASGIKTLAEGVETQEQLDILIELGCDQVQGYLLGRPVPADVFERMYIKEKEKVS